MTDLKSKDKVTFKPPGGKTRLGVVLGSRGNNRDSRIIQAIDEDQCNHKYGIAQVTDVHVIGEVCIVPYQTLRDKVVSIIDTWQPDKLARWLKEQPGIALIAKSEDQIGYNPENDGYIICPTEQSPEVKQ